jgi:hypothetical protein
MLMVYDDKAFALEFETVIDVKIIYLRNFFLFKGIN